ncbi:MAG: transaldolase [Gaiellaceae bacterium]|jgi:transaldolase|nr:transaldolase [Gaiellaceae bacterium]
MPESRLHKVAERGQSVWFDTLSRDLVSSGELKRMMKEDAVTGITSNPTIFQKALSQGDAYDEQIKELLSETDDATEIFFRLALDDIRDACDVLAPVHEKSPWDGYVSMEVLPSVAYDTEKTFDQARWIATEVDRPNLFVKIPATEPGLPAIEDCIAHGTSINITLIFSLERYKAVVEAYLRGLERLIAGGGDPTKISSVASFFVSRVDTEADKRLEALGNKKLQGKLAIANAKLAYEHFLETFQGERWEYLKSKGARVQAPLWASTSTKNPEYRDVMYVEELIGPNTVNTMPLETIEAFQDHGEVRGDTVTEGIDEAHQVFADLAEAGVDYDDVVLTLEQEGVQKFADSFEELLQGVAAKRETVAA